MEGVVRPPICFEEMVVPLLLYLPFDYRNSALLRGVISMNSVGRWPIFFFISYHSHMPNTSPKVRREKGLFEEEMPGPVLTAGCAGLYVGLPGTSTGPQPESCSRGGLGSEPAQYPAARCRHRCAGATPACPVLAPGPHQNCVLMRLLVLARRSSWPLRCNLRLPLAHSV
jgi:hypothetical protein